MAVPLSLVYLVDADTQPKFHVSYGENDREFVEVVRFPTQTSLLVCSCEWRTTQRRQHVCSESEQLYCPTRTIHELTRSESYVRDVTNGIINRTVLCV